MLGDVGRVRPDVGQTKPNQLFAIAVLVFSLSLFHCFGMITLASPSGQAHLLREPSRPHGSRPPFAPSRASLGAVHHRSILDACGREREGRERISLRRSKVSAIPAGLNDHRGWKPHDAQEARGESGTFATPPCAYRGSHVRSLAVAWRWTRGLAPSARCGRRHVALCEWGYTCRARTACHA